MEHALDCTTQDAATNYAAYIVMPQPTAAFSSPVRFAVDMLQSDAEMHPQALAKEQSDSVVVSIYL